MVGGANRKQFTTPPRARRNRRMVQLELPKFDKNGQHRGAFRKGAGRPPKGARAGSPHKRRAEIDRRHPQHVVIRVLGSVGWLRRYDMFRAIRHAITTTFAREGFRIVHFSVQTNHIHLLCEADNKEALASGMKGFQISAAKRLNAVLSKRRRTKILGQVFADRYHVEALGSPTQTRRALCYVLNNWRRHHRHHHETGLYDDRIDPYSTAIHFPGWRERTQAALQPPRGYEPPPLVEPRTWLLREGYLRARGGPISVFTIPGPR